MPKIRCGHNFPHRRDRHHEKKHYEQVEVNRWQNLECSPHPESCEPDCAVLAVITEECSRDEESTQHKEQIDPESRGSAERGKSHVVANDLKDRRGP
jgi:hypothetical protein